MIATKPSIGTGIYSLPEAAMYARLRPEVLRRWLFGKNEYRVLEPQFEQKRKEKVLSFVDFVQVLQVRNLRSSPVTRRFSLKKIRQAIDAARREYGFEFPLSVRNSIYIYQDDLVIKLPEDKGYVMATGPTRRNYMITDVVDFYKRGLEFDEDGIAKRYLAWKIDHKIYIDPDVKFGEPFLDEYGYTATTILEACRVEGDPSRVAADFEIPEDAVHAVLEYYDHLQGNAVA